MFAVLGGCHELQMHNQLLKLRLFDALVHPMMPYACKVWAIVGGKSALQNMERVEIASGYTSSKFVYAEFGRLPLKQFWLQQCIKYLCK